MSEDASAPKWRDLFVQANEILWLVRAPLENDGFWDKPQGYGGTYDDAVGQLAALRDQFGQLKRCEGREGIYAYDAECALAGLHAACVAAGMLRKSGYVSLIACAWQEVCAQSDRARNAVASWWWVVKTTH